jgi:hypothetical protein
MAGQLPLTPGEPLGDKPGMNGTIGTGASRAVCVSGIIIG